LERVNPSIWNVMDNASAPLADYFWIAGIENISYGDSLPTISTQVEETIVEDGEPAEDSDNVDTFKRTSSTATARHSRHNSGNRLSRSTIRTLEELDGNTISNRSSATIRAVPAPGGVNGSDLEGTGGLLGDFDFDKALFKFAAARENFLEDLSFTAGAKTQSRPPMVNPRTERIKADAASNERLNPLKSIRGSIRGSIRRKISFRDMSSVRRQSTAARPGTSSSDCRAVKLSSRQCRDIPSWACVPAICETCHDLC
jgi:hypothetical protein